MGQGQERVIERRDIAGMVMFLALTALLALAVPFSLEHARTNAPLKQALVDLIY